jgi:putative ABC transport system permease protein
MIVETVRFALRGVAANKLRSGLTVLGLLIGVAAVILLVAVGQGASASVQSSIEGLGTNTLTVRSEPSSGGGAQIRDYSLTVDDARALAESSAAPDVKSVSPQVSAQSVTATYKGATHTVGQSVGTYPSYFAASGSKVAKGGYFTNDDVTAARKVVVIGTTVADDLFGDVDPVGKKVQLNGVPFTVRGVLASQDAGGLSDANDTAVAPLSAVQQSLSGYGSIDSILVAAASPTSVNAAEGEVTAVLNARHDVTDTASSPYSVLNQAQLLQARSSALSTFTTLLAAVAGISLLVGGIGVTNIMLVTVTERTREIGIRKALGARRSAILGQFLVEATLLSALGGLIGVAIGVVGSQFSFAGVQPVLVPGSIVLAVTVSVAIGLFFGSYPAARAGALRPIDALRYE